VSLACALYRGSVIHHRLRPRRHRLRYRAFWLLIDLDRLAEVAARLRLFSRERFNLFSFHEADHGNGGPLPLRRQVELKLAAAGLDPSGVSIRLLCMPRILGYGFNPLSIYFCLRNEQPVALLYEVHNTFGERHTYLIPATTQAQALHQHCRKAFYVSPFLDMDMTYDFRISGPGDMLQVGIRGSDAQGTLITAALSARRAALSDRALLATFLALPLTTLKVIGAIHWEALRLWLKGIAVRPRPPAPASGLTICHSQPVREASHVN